MTTMALVSAVLMVVTAAFLFNKSLVLGFIVLALAIIILYLNLPVACLLKQAPLGKRPLSRIFLVCWLGIFSALNMPKAALVYLNNRITGSLTVQPAQAHVLLSRCLQRSDCPYAVTADIDNCRECGRCKIGAVKRICLERNVSVSVESGGTSARDRLKEQVPSLVLAVACQRELLAGIMDTRIPVVGVLLESGERPCIDSDLRMANFEERIDNALKEE